MGKENMVTLLKDIREEDLLSQAVDAVRDLLVQKLGNRDWCAARDALA